MNYKFEGTSVNTGRTAPEFDAVSESVDYIDSQAGLGSAAQFKTDLDTDQDTSWIRIDEIKSAIGSANQLIIGVWFKQETIADDGTLFDFLSSTPSNGGGVRVTNGVDQETLEACYAKSGAGQVCGDIDLGAGYDGTQWNHLIVRIADNTGNIEFSIDGVVQLILNNPNAAPILSAFMANDMTWGFGSGFIIDEIKIFDLDFNAQEQCVLVIDGTWNAATESCDPTPVINDSSP